MPNMKVKTAQPVSVISPGFGLLHFSLPLFQTDSNTDTHSRTHHGEMKQIGKSDNVDIINSNASNF